MDEQKRIRAARVRDLAPFASAEEDLSDERENSPPSGDRDDHEDDHSAAPTPNDHRIIKIGRSPEESTTKSTPSPPPPPKVKPPSSSSATIARPTTTATATATTAASASVTVTPRIDISRASSSSYQEDSSPEREFILGKSKGVKLETAFGEEMASDLHSSTEELSFHDTEEEEGKRRKSKSSARTSTNTPFSELWSGGGTETATAARKDSACSGGGGGDITLLSIGLGGCSGGRTSRVSSVGSVASGGSIGSNYSAASHCSALSHLSATSNLSRGSSPHRMSLETSFCGPKPLLNTTSADLEATVESVATAATKSPVPTIRPPTSAATSAKGNVSEKNETSEESVSSTKNGLAMGVHKGDGGGDEVTKKIALNSQKTKINKPQQQQQHKRKKPVIGNPKTQTFISLYSDEEDEPSAAPTSVDQFEHSTSRQKGPPFGIDSATQKFIPLKDYDDAEKERDSANKNEDDDDDDNDDDNEHMASEKRLKPFTNKTLINFINKYDVTRCDEAEATTTAAAATYSQQECDYHHSGVINREFQTFISLKDEDDRPSVDDQSRRHHATTTKEKRFQSQKSSQPHILVGAANNSDAEGGGCEQKARVFQKFDLVVGDDEDENRQNEEITDDNLSHSRSQDYSHACDRDKSHSHSHTRSHSQGHSWKRNCSNNHDCDQLQLQQQQQHHHHHHHYHHHHHRHHTHSRKSSQHSRSDLKSDGIDDDDTISPARPSSSSPPPPFDETVERTWQRNVAVSASPKGMQSETVIVGETYNGVLSRDSQLNLRNGRGKANIVKYDSRSKESLINGRYNDDEDRGHEFTNQKQQQQHSISECNSSSYPSEPLNFGFQRKNETKINSKIGLENTSASDSNRQKKSPRPMGNDIDEFGLSSAATKSESINEVDDDEEGEEMEETEEQKLLETDTSVDADTTTGTRVGIRQRTRLRPVTALQSDDEDEHKILVNREESFEELPYVPTTLPLERPVAAPIVPVKQRATKIDIRPVERPHSHSSTSSASHQSSIFEFHLPADAATLISSCTNVKMKITATYISTTTTLSDALTTTTTRTTTINDNVEEIDSIEKLRITLPWTATSSEYGAAYVGQRRRSSGTGIGTKSPRRKISVSAVDDESCGGSENHGCSSPAPPLPPRKSNSWISFADDVRHETRQSPKRITTLPPPPPPPPPPLPPPPSPLLLPQTTSSSLPPPLAQQSSSLPISSLPPTTSTLRSGVDLETGIVANDGRIYVNANECSCECHESPILATPPPPLSLPYTSPSSGGGSCKSNHNDIRRDDSYARKRR